MHSELDSIIRPVEILLSRLWSWSWCNAHQRKNLIELEWTLCMYNTGYLGIQEYLQAKVLCINRATASDILLVSYIFFQGTAHNSMINIINFSLI
jgi:hypothetical protein